MVNKTKIQVDWIIIVDSIFKPSITEGITYLPGLGVAAVYGDLYVFKNSA